MDSSFGSIIGFVIPLLLVVLAVGFVFGRRGRDRRDLSGPPQIDPPPPLAPAPAQPAQPRSRELDPATRIQIEAALNARQKIEAIKLLRDATGLGLKEAKEAIEEGRF